MKWFKSIFSIVLQNFRKWKYDCRIWIALFIVLIFIHSLTKGLSDICDYTGVKSSPWTFPFLYMQYYNKMLFFFPLILIFSNAPFIDKISSMYLSEQAEINGALVKCFILWLHLLCTLPLLWCSLLY